MAVDFYGVSKTPWSKPRPVPESWLHRVQVSPLEDSRIYMHFAYSRLEARCAALPLLENVEGFH